MGEGSVVDEEEAREAVFFRLEGLGYRVGLGVVERYVSMFLYPTILPLPLLLLLLLLRYILFELDADMSLSTASHAPFPAPPIP
jgi:hypothetical protein